LFKKNTVSVLVCYQNQMLGLPRKGHVRHVTQKHFRALFIGLIMLYFDWFRWPRGTRERQLTLANRSIVNTFKSRLLSPLNH